MKELLEAIKTQLQTDLTYIRDNDIYITPHENYVPNHVRFPCVGIKEGDILRRELAGEMMEVTLNVILSLMVQLSKPEANILGDASADKNGLLDITDDIHESLDENLLDITGMQEAGSPSENGSRFFGDEKESIQQKLIKYQYIKEEARP